MWPRCSISAATGADAPWPSVPAPRTVHRLSSAPREGVGKVHGVWAVHCACGPGACGGTGRWSHATPPPGRRRPRGPSGVSRAHADAQTRGRPTGPSASGGAARLCGKCGKGRGESWSRSPVPHTVHGVGSAPRGGACGVWEVVCCVCGLPLAASQAGEHLGRAAGDTRQPCPHVGLCHTRSAESASSSAPMESVLRRCICIRCGSSVGVHCVWSVRRPSEPAPSSAVAWCSGACPSVRINGRCAARSARRSTPIDSMARV